MLKKIVKSMYAIIQKDEKGLFVRYRTGFEESEFAEGVVAIIKGNGLNELREKSRKFVQENKGREVRLMTSIEIADFLAR